MDELKIGDEVLTVYGTFSKVYSFGHYDISFKAPFLQVLTSTMDTKHPLEISAMHLVYVKYGSHKAAKKTLASAGELKLGDYLVTKEGPSEILSIVAVEREGVYSPPTFTGNLMVNGVAASGYVTRGWLTQRGLGTMVHYHQHGSTTPLRAYCSFFGCENETYQEVTGFSPFVQFWYGFEQWQLDAGMVVQVLSFVLLAFPILLPMLVGKLLSLPSSALATHVIVATVGYYVICKKTKKTVPDAPVKA